MNTATDSGRRGNRPCDLTVAEVSARLREGTLTPTELTQSLLSQIRRLEPEVEAWVWLDEEAALSAARQAEREMRQAGPRSPLHGVPVGVKDIFFTAGVPTEMGSPLYRGFVPHYDAAAVARLKAAGAILLGKTVTCEFASFQPSATRNPWNLEHTPGGSSSGSAAAVAARMCPLALGTQTGGSVIRPAAYCGVVGLKPTYGLISSFGVHPFAPSLDTMGAFTRSVEDAALALQVLAGRDPHDPNSLDVPVPDYVSTLHGLSHPPRIGLLRRFFSEHATLEVWRNVEGVCQALARAGAVVEEACLPTSFQAALDGQALLNNVEGAVTHRDNFPSRRESYGPKLRDSLDKGLRASGTDYAAARQLQPRFAREVEESLAPFDVLLCPSTEVPAPRGLASTGDPLFQRAWTYAGVPSLSIPSGLSEGGLPLAVQLIARKLDESRLLAVGTWCERVLAFKASPRLVDE